MKTENMNHKNFGNVFRKTILLISFREEEYKQDPVTTIAEVLKEISSKYKFANKYYNKFMRSKNLQSIFIQKHKNLENLYASYLRQKSNFN